MKRATVIGVTGLGCVMLLMAGLAPAAAVSPADDGGRAGFGDVQNALEALAEDDAVVGAVGGAYVDGERVDRGAAGSRLLDGRGGAIPADARYRVGSQTKQMTATILLQLVEEKRLGLDDRLSALLPETAERDLVERADEITVRQLLDHTSGIPDWFRADLVDFFDFTTYLSPTELVKRSRTRPREQEPGERFSYSNTNYMLLGMIIERVTGRPLAAEFDRRVFQPLGMKDSYLTSRPPQSIRGPHGHGYYPHPDGTLRDMDRLNASYGYAAGGVISTADDISAFQRAFTQGRLLPPELQKVLNGPPQGTPRPEQPARPCEGRLQVGAVKGGAPGFTSLTYGTHDGRIQFAVSVTLAVAHSDADVQPAIDEAAEAVLCPEK